MRPPLLDPLFTPLARLPGIGPKIATLFDRLLARQAGQAARIVDILFHLPTAGIDRSLSSSIADAPVGVIATFEATVEDHRKPLRPTMPFKVIVGDETGDAALVFFKPRPGQIERDLPIGAKRIISGKLEVYDGYRQMVHPERILELDRSADMPAMEPVYGLTEGLTNRRTGMAARAALAKLPRLPEWQDAAWLRQQGWLDFGEALKTFHEPRIAGDFNEDSPALARLAYDELLAGQVALMMMRARMREKPGRATAGDGRIVARLTAALPFALTAAQSRAIIDIHWDMAEPKRMLRLLQGDVGSGKTVVALMAMARAAEAGRQSVLMAPTEILARQHDERIAPMAEACGLKTALLTGRVRLSERRAILEALAKGKIDILFGTHALFQEDVAFHDLALAIVDEQHKFGVHQRLALGRKGAAVDLLVMTATPIPRTLVLTMFGDMDVSILDEKPAGRKPIDTRAIALDRLEDVIAALGRAMTEDQRIYWVCPLVSESDKLEDVAAAEARHRTLSEAFPGSVGLVHGKLAGAEKEAAVADFASGRTQILVATTVIEVGIDVPEATIMVIEHAERFGLAQLHQLRGRVGRGSKPSRCLLLYRAPLGQIAEARLTIMRETEDGFRIAEEDLRLRGEGDLLGSKQSGEPGFRVVRLSVHAKLLAAARDDAKLLLERDPELTSERGRAIRILLYLFEREEAVRLLRAG